MGYDVEMSIAGVVIPAAKVAAALSALKDLMADVGDLGGGGSWSPAGKVSSNFAWVGTEEVLQAIEERNLVKALEEWRYGASAGASQTPVEQLASGEEFTDVCVDYFEGSKWGDDDALWSTLAPFVAEGAVIEFRGEDDHRWRYIFTGEGYRNETGMTVWT